MEVLIYAVDATAVVEAVTAAGGRLVLALTANLLVVSLPEGASVSSIPGASEAVPEQLDGTERELAQAWLAKFGTTSRAADRLAKPEQQPIPWDTPGYTPPNYLPGRATTRSTNTPTSVVLTGSVAVGIVMVSGPPDSPPWTAVHGALKYVSVGADGTVWGVNADDKIYRFDAGSGIWNAVSGALKQVSVGDAANVWGVNADDKIYRWNGNSWTQVAGALKHVSVAADGTVWGVNADDKIYTRDGNAWSQQTGQLKQVSVGMVSVVWGVNKNDQIYTRQPGLGLALTSAEKSLIMSEVLEGLTFLATADPDANVSFIQDWRDISVTAAPGAGHDYESFEAPWRNAALQAMGFAASRSGSLAYVTSLRTNQRTDWAYVAYFTKYPLHHFAYAGDERLVMHYNNDGWGTSAINQVFAHETCHIFGAADEYGDCGCGGSGHFDIPNNNCINCTTAQIPCLMSKNTLSLCSWSRGQIGWSPWAAVAGALKHVSVGTDGTVCGVNADDKIYRRDGNAWTQINGRLKQIDVGNANAIWGVNSDDKIYRWNGNSWTQVSGALKHVSVAADGTVWGVNADDKIYRWGGAAWVQVPGALKQASVGASGLVWGVNADDKIYRLR